MKTLRITSWILILMSIIFKLLHYPFAAPLIILGNLLLFIHAFIFLFRNSITNLPAFFFHLNISLWTSYFMFRFMFWPFSQILFIISFIIGLTYIILLGVNKSKVVFVQIILFTYMAGLIVLSYTQGCYIYYFFNLNTLLNKTSNPVNYQGWDKYSWFLYCANKNQEASQANQNAEYAVKRSIEIDTNNREASQFVIYIKQHKQNIKDKNWNEYTRP